MKWGVETYQNALANIFTCRQSWETLYGKDGVENLARVAGTV